MHNLLDITEAQLRGGGDLIAGLTVKTTEELHDIINRLSKGNTMLGGLIKGISK